MSAKSTPSPVRKSPVVVDALTIQSLFDTVKGKHGTLKAEIRTLFHRCRERGEITQLKAMLLEFPPLHSLNDMLDEVLDSPARVPRRKLTAKKYVSPQPTTAAKKCSANAGSVAASKALRFSPHLFKKEPTSSDAQTPTGALDLHAADSEEKEEDDDDVVEIQSL